MLVLCFGVKLVKWYISLNSAIKNLFLGYRSVKLLDKAGNELPYASLFIHIENMLAQKENKPFIENMYAQKENKPFIENMLAQKENKPFIENMLAQKENKPLHRTECKLEVKQRPISVTITFNEEGVQVEQDSTKCNLKLGQQEKIFIEILNKDENEEEVEKKNNLEDTSKEHKGLMDRHEIF